MKEFMSGDELYRYLHISKRKMKYLLENGYIPMTDTGRKTHRYKIRLEDAKAFRRRMKQEPRFLSELTGMFNTRWAKKEPRPALGKKDIDACRRNWAEKLADQPEALRIPDAAAHQRSVRERGGMVDGGAGETVLFEGELDSVYGGSVRSPFRIKCRWLCPRLVQSDLLFHRPVPNA